MHAPHGSLVYLNLIQYAVGGSLYPFLVLYLLDRKLTQPEINGALFAASLASASLPFLWGWVADRLLAVNRLIPLLHLASAAVLLVMSRLVSSYEAIVLCMLLYGGLQQPTNALANALCYRNLSDPPRQFGQLRLWGSVGWILPSLPIFLWHAFTGGGDLEFAIYLTAGLQVTLVLTSGVLPHTPPAAERASRTAGTSFSRELRTLLSNPGFVVLLVVAFLMLSSFSIAFYHTGARLEEGGVPRRWVGPVQSLGVVFEVPLFLTLRWAIHRFGYRVTLAVGGFAALARHLVFAYGPPPLLLLLASPLVAPMVVYYLITASLVANSLAPRGVKATAQSIFALVSSGLGTMSGLWATRLLTQASGGDLQGAFLFGAACAATAICLVPRIRLPGPTT